jgi:hypothetical protein
MQVPFVVQFIGIKVLFLKEERLKDGRVYVTGRVLESSHSPGSILSKGQRVTESLLYIKAKLGTPTVVLTPVTAEEVTMLLLSSSQ